MLQNKLWHTTSKSRYEQILKCGYISPNPDIPDSEKWATSQGPDNYPYVRSLGGVSLFDLSVFDIEQHGQDQPFCNFYEFVPYRRDWKHAIWIEIDRNKIQENFISGDDLINKWRGDGSARKIIARIEAAHIGPISTSNFLRVLYVSSSSEEITELSF